MVADFQMIFPFFGISRGPHLATEPTRTDWISSPFLADCKQAVKKNCEPIRAQSALLCGRRGNHPTNVERGRWFLRRPHNANRSSGFNTSEIATHDSIFLFSSDVNCFVSLSRRSNMPSRIRSAEKGWKPLWTKSR